MKTSLLILTPLLFCPGLFPQVAPSAMGGARNFDYVLRYSQSAQSGGSYGNWQTASPSAEVEYSNGSKRAPFALHHAGGYTWTLVGPEYSTGWFQRLSIGQRIFGRKWRATLTDDMSYLPQAPVTGFSGIPGIGEPIGTPAPPTANQSILTLGTYALYNDAAAGATRILNGAYSLRLQGGYDLLRFPDSNGLDTNTAFANGELIRRLNARNLVSGQYAYTQSTYPGASFTFNTSSIMGKYERNWSRSMHTSIALGPTWINSSLPKFIPPSTTLSVNATLNQQLRRGSLNLNYLRGTGGGSGYMLGQKLDTVSGGYSRDFERRVTLEMTAGYNRTTPLAQRGVIEFEFGGIQVSRHLGRHASAFVNYTVQVQSGNLALPSNVVQEPLHVISFGTTFESRNQRRH